jgi:PncC family amidohydrolase
VLRDDDALARAIAAALLARGARVAVAETTAGGLISARLLSVPGASAWFERGVVCYSARAKEETAGVPADILRSSGAVSVAAVTAMAEGLRERASVDYALAESGIAGPQAGRRSTKPAGSVVVAVAGPSGTEVRELVLPGTRVQVMEQIAEQALATLASALASGQ